MDFSYSDDERHLRQAVSQMADGAFSDDALWAIVGGDDRRRERAWQSFVDLGFAGVLVPESLGGSGGSVVDACLIAEVLGERSAPVPFVGTAILAAAMLRAAGREGEADLRRLAAGQPYVVLLGSDMDLPTGTGSVAFDWLDGAIAISLAAEGLVRAEIGEARINRLDPLHPLAVLRDPIECTAGTRNEAQRRARAIGASGVASFLTGLSSAAMHQAVDYAKQREQYGRPIGAFQAVQHLCADMLVDVEACRSIARGASWIAEHTEIDDAETAALSAHAWCSDAAIRVCESAIQVLGGIGVTWEHDAHLRLRSAHLFSRLLGGADAMAETVIEQRRLAKSA